MTDIHTVSIILAGGGNITIPDNVNVEKLETILMNTLDVASHKRLRDVLKKKIVEDSEKTKEMLVNAIALAGSTKNGVPDRLMKLRKQAKEIWTAV